MIEVKDRIPTYPGRVKLIPVAGQANTYDMVRADEPIEPGTPINRALFQTFIDEMNAIRQQVDDKLFEISQRVQVGDLDDGTVFGLYENGVLVPFIKLTNNYEDSERILVVRQNCITMDVLMNADEVYYENCKTDMWLNNEYLQMLDLATKSVITTIYVEVSDKNNETTNILRKAFLLSLNEYRIGAYPSFGPLLSYFSTEDRKIAMFEGSPTNHWVRGSSSSGVAKYVTTGGILGSGSSSTFIAGIRPAFTLPPDFEVTVGLPSTENVMATAEV